MAFSGQRPEVFFAVRQFEIVELFFQRGIDRIFGHGWMVIVV
jgi:hypothetical protein